jgi:hypothetical protein
VLYGGMSALGQVVAVDPDPYEFDGVQWLRRVIPTAPGPRFHHAMVAVPQGLRVFGGATASTSTVHDVYDYDGVRFQPRGRRPMVGAAVAYDAGAGATVVVGMVDGVQQTARWDGIELVVQNVFGPSPRRGHALASGLGAGVVLFGGFAASVFHGDTWQFQAGAWQNLGIVGPSPRSGHAMATDPLRNRVVLHGGFDGRRDLDDLWEFDGAVWTRRLPTGPVPGARFAHAMAYDAAAARVVMHGRDELRNTSETWDWDGTAWSLVYSGPVPGFDVAIAWDAAGDQLVLAANELPPRRAAVVRIRPRDRVVPVPAHGAHGRRRESRIRPRG